MRLVYSEAAVADLVRLRQAPGTELVARHHAVVRTDEMDAAPFQGLDVGRERARVEVDL